MLQGTRFDDKDTKSNKELYEKLMILLKQKSTCSFVMTMEYSNSKKEFRKAQKLDPRLPDAYSNLGCAYGMSEESSVRRGHAVHGRTC